MKKGIKIILKILAGIIILLVVFLAGAFLATKNNVIGQIAEKEVLYLGKIIGKYDKQDGKWVQNTDFDLYWEVWDLIKSDYVNKDDLADKQLFYGSLEGLVSSLDDPYSEFMDPQENKQFEEDMSGTFEGIGAEIGIRDELLTVISPIDGTPAQKAGIMAGDKILEINGESTQGMDINEAVSKIKGPKGTEVILSIFRDSFDDIKEFKIIRDVISIKSVSYEKIENNLFLIKINSFNGDTNYLFSQAIKEVLAQDPDGIIVDLRNNPGGYLEVAVMML
ncbi:MAG TPA: PDZ domain-containing protein, partial [bacterium]|nr:PDZ domain-containing protein [bacterium]